MNKIIKICSLFLLFYSLSISAQDDPVLEFSTNSRSITDTGPVSTATFQFVNNTNNPSGTNYVLPTTNPLSVTFTAQNGQVGSTNPLVFGYASGATEISQRLSSGATSPLATNFTYAGYAPTGTGITPTGGGGTANYALLLQLLTNDLQGQSTSGTYYMADLKIAFSRPVNNPVLHIAGIGANGAPPLVVANSFELSTYSASSAVTLSRLSGDANFVLTGGNLISSTVPNVSDQAEGSILVKGKGITELIFKVYVTSNGASPDWASAGDPGDGNNISISVPESDLAVTKTVDKTNPAIGTLVNFTVTATNNGMSQSPNTTVTDLLPAGYTYSASTPSVGTYDSATGVWSIGTLAIGASATMNIAAYVKNTGPYLNTATIAGDNTDPVATNNTATATVTPVVPPIFTCNDGRAYVSQVYPTDATTTILTYINPTTGAYANIGGTSGILYNSLGYNPVDNYLYALRIEGSVGTPGPNMSHLLRIDANGAAYDLGPIPGLPIGNFLQATFDASGNMYVPRVPGLADTNMYIINVASMTQTSVSPSPAAVNSSDVVYASDGKLYMVINEKGLVSMTTAGVVTPIGLQTYAGSFGSMFADALGNLYGVLNSTVGALPGSGTGVGDPNGGLYQIDKATGVRLKILNIPFPGNHDGASCINADFKYAASLSISKTDGVTAYTAGGSTTYTIVASNTGISGVMKATVTDALPAGITVMNYTAIASTGSSTSVPIAGSTGAINDVVNLLAGGTVTYTVTVNIPATFTGNLVNTAVITPPSNVTDADGSANNTATDTDTLGACYKPATTTGASLPTNHGITALGRAGDNSNWPMVRNGAWTVLEAKSKGFVVNRIATTAAVTAIANPVEGMMVYDVQADCLKINTDGTATGWKCFNTQTCP